MTAMETSTILMENPGATSRMATQRQRSIRTAVIQPAGLVITVILTTVEASLLLPVILRVLIFQHTTKDHRLLGLAIRMDMLLGLRLLMAIILRRRLVEEDIIRAEVDTTLAVQEAATPTTPSTPP